MVKELNNGDSGADILANLGPMSSSAKNNAGLYKPKMNSAMNQ